MVRQLAKLRVKPPYCFHQDESCIVVTEAREGHHAAAVVSLRSFHPHAKNKLNGMHIHATTDEMDSIVYTGDEMCMWRGGSAGAAREKKKSF